MNTLLYLSFGEGRHQHEMAYALKTLARFSKRQCVGENGRIVLLTDTPAFFRGDEDTVDVTAVDSGMIAAWIGNGGHFFRSRIKAMQWIMAQHGGKLLAVDGDTYFTRPPALLFERISRGKTVMYEPECAFADAAIPDYQFTGKVLDDLKRFPLRDGRTLPCGSRTMQWNAGVLGLCQDDGMLLDDVLAVLDVLHPLLHGVWSAEQTTFSIVWGAMTEVRPAYNHVFHYNSHPRRISFDQHIPDLLAACASLSLSSTKEGERLYAERLRRSSRAAIKHLGKKVLVSCRIWDGAMRLKSALGGRHSMSDALACHTSRS